jgi:hypothetical protein
MLSIGHLEHSLCPLHFSLGALYPFPAELHAHYVGYKSRGLALFLATHESNFRAPSVCYIMAAHCVLRLTPARAS